MKYPTVFVTGAGASQPYAFSLGIDLTRRVGDEMFNGATVETFRDLGLDHNKMRAFANSLRLSGRQSVDAFLEHRPEFMDVGKAAIARVLIEWEQTGTLLAGREGAWLDYLFDKLNCPFERFGSNEVAFITFNYDRSIEHYLFTCLQNSYGKSAEDCAHQLSQIPIIHLHGDLGALPWQESDSAKIRTYEPTISPEAVRIAASRIKIIHEDIAGRDREFAEAKRILNLADQIYFLGFGYNQTNMERLGVDKIKGGVVYGTGYGLTDHERDATMDAVGRKITIVNQHCLGLLRNVVRW